MRRRTWRVWQVDAAGAAVCLAMGLAFFLCGVQPLASRHRQNEDRQRQVDALRRQHNEVCATLNAARAKLDETKARLEAQPLRLLPLAATNERLAELSALATRLGLEIREVRPGEAVPGTHYHVVPIHLAGSGQYPRCAAFLRALQTAFPDTGVRILEMTAPATNPLEPGTFRLLLSWHASLTAGPPSGGEARKSG
jgi:Tfp pilus assembly protein PilO